MKNPPHSTQALFQLNGIPPIGISLSMALQHLVAMIVGCVTPAIIIANVVGLPQAERVLLIQASLVMSAVTTLLELFPIGGKFGAGLPVMFGVSFAYLPSMQSIAAGGGGIASIAGAMIVGGVILSLYTGLLGYVGAETGMSLDLLARKAFGTKGSYLPSAMISFTQIGWFGVGIAMFAIPVANELLGGSKTAEWALVIVAGICMTASAYFGIKSLTIVSYIAVPMVAVLGTVAMVLAVMRGDGTIVDQFAKSSGTLTVIGGAGLVVGSFVSGGTATPNFSRFAKSGKVGAITTVIAFFIGNSLMFFFGGVSSVYVGGNDIFEVMINLGLFYLAILVLGLNIWTTNDNALYSAGLGLANIFGQKKKPMVLVSGIIGTVLAVWLYWNFCGWLNILNCTLPPVGIILVLGYFLNKEKYQDVEVSENVNWFAVIGVVLGAVVANLVHWGIASINGMVVAAVCYLIGRAVEKK